MRYATLFLGRAHGCSRDAASVDADLAGSHANLRGLDLLHFLDGGHGTADQLVGLELDPVGRLRLDPVPKRLELGAELYLLLQPVRPFVLVLADVALDLVGRQQVDDGGGKSCMRLGQARS